MKPKTALYYALEGDLVYDPDVELRFGPRSRERRARLRERLEAAMALGRNDGDMSQPCCTEIVRAVENR